MYCNFGTVDFGFIINFSTVIIIIIIIITFQSKMNLVKVSMNRIKLILAVPFNIYNQMLERRPLLTKSVTTGIVEDDDGDVRMAMRVKVLMKLKVMMRVRMMAMKRMRVMMMMMRRFVI